MARPTELESEARKLPTAERLAPHAEVEGAAARLIGTEMELAPKKVITNPDKALASAMKDLVGEGGPLAGKLTDEPHPEGGRRLFIQRADGELIEVRVIVGETEKGNIANFARGSHDKEFIVTLSDHARESTHARALAHEIEELRYHGTDKAAKADLLQLRPRGIASGEVLPAELGTDLGKLQKLESELATAKAASPRDNKEVRRLESKVEEILTKPQGGVGEVLRLSAHDRGRLAELQVLDVQLQRARGASPRDEVQIARLAQESQALVAHLGLVTGSAAPARRAAVERILAAEGVPGRALHGALETAVSGAASNPLLRPRPTSLEDTATLAGQISRARALGEKELADSLMTLARSMVRERFEGNVPQNRQAAMAELEADFTRLISNDDDRKSALALMADVVDRESARARALAADNRARRLSADLEQANRDADPRTLGKLRAEIDLDQKRLSGRDMDAKALERQLTEVGRAFGRAAGLERERLAAEFALLSAQREGASLKQFEVEQLQKRLGENQGALAKLQEQAPDLPQRIADLQSEIRQLAGTAATEWAHAQRPHGATAKVVAQAPIGREPLHEIDDLGLRRTRDPRKELVQQELIRQRYGDIPDFQEFGALLEAYYARYPDKRKLPFEQRLQEENGLFAQWSRGRYFSPETGKMAALDDVRYVPAGKGSKPDELKGRLAPAPQPTDPVRVGDASRPLDQGDVKGIVAEIDARRAARGEAPLGATEQGRLSSLLTAPEGSRPQLSLRDAEDLSVALTSVCKQLRTSLKATPEALQAPILDRLTAVETAIRDVREALGVAAGRRVAQELFPRQPEVMEGSGANTVDLAFGDRKQGPVIVVECKGRAAASRGSRLAVEEGTGETVRAEQGTPQYLRSVAQSMQSGQSTEAATTGAAIQQGMATGAPKVRYVIVHQEILPDGSLGKITVKEYDMSGQ